MIEQALCPVLIGREAELAALEAALLEARRGSGGLAVLGGEGGPGKARLAGRLRGGGGSRPGGGAPKVRERVGAAAADLGALVPELGDPGPIGVSSDAPQSKLRLYEAILVLLPAAPAGRGLLLIVEDLPWGGAS